MECNTFATSSPWGFFSFFGHLIHQTCHYVLYSQFLHYHDVLWGNKMFVQGWQILKQSHDNIFISQIFFQARKFNPQVP